MERIALVSAVMTIALTFQACGSNTSTGQKTGSLTASSTSAASSTSSPSSMTQTGPATSKTQASAAGGEGLTGYGATDAAWNAHHQPDTRFDPGTVYDPDPSLARNGDLQHDARYYDVVHGGAGGRVDQYDMRFAPGTTVGEARQSVLASEFPPGTRVRDFKTLDTCAILVVHSSKLSGITPNADASVEFVSGEAGDTYDAGDVWGAIVSFGGLTEC